MTIRERAESLLARLPAAGPRPAPAEQEPETDDSLRLIEVILTFALLIAALYVVGWMAWQTWGLADGAPESLIIGVYDRWDVLNYEIIAEFGYDTAYHFPAWFPPSPIVLRLFIELGVEPYWPATIVTLALAGALMVALYRLARLDFGPRMSRDVSLYFMLFPAALFLYVPYNEVFLLLSSVLAFYFARRQQWALAGIAAGVASGTRVPGILVGVAVAIEYAASVDWDWRRVRANAAWIALAPVGLLAYMAYLGFAVDDPLAFYHRVDDIPHEETIGARSGFIHFIPSLLDDVRTIWISDSENETIMNVSGLLGVTFWGIAVMLMIWFRMRLSYVVFSVLILVPALWVGRLDALNRYALPAFPMFIAVGLLLERYPLARTPYIVVSLALLMTTGMLFATNRLPG